MSLRPFSSGIISSKLLRGLRTDRAADKVVRFQGIYGKQSGSIVSKGLRFFHNSTSAGFQKSFTQSKDQNSNKDNKKKNEDDSKQDEDNNDKEFKNISDYFKSKEFFRSLYLTIGLTVMFHLLTIPSAQQMDNELLTFQDFKTKYLEKGLVKKIYIVNKYLVEAELLPQATQHLGSGNGFFSVPTQNPIVAFTICLLYTSRCV